jgi:uncharacterized protein YqgC (DUF456 family)
MGYLAFVVLTAVAMLPGLLGVFIPLIPGIPYMFVVALVFAFADRFQHLSGAELSLLAVIAIVSLVIDYLAGILGARAGGASKKALLFGFIGLILGVIVLPPFGGILGIFLGVLVAELAGGKTIRTAFKAGQGSVIGALTGIGINLVLALLSLVLFVIFALR